MIAQSMISMKRIFRIVRYSRQVEKLCVSKRKVQVALSSSMLLGHEFSTAAVQMDI